MWSKKSEKYTKCRMHGGASTGPRTAEGLERCGKTNWKSGQYSAQKKAERRAFRNVIRWMNWETAQLERELRVILQERKRQQKSVNRNAPAIVVYALKK